MKMKNLKLSVKLVIGMLLSVMFLTTAQAQQSPEALAKQRSAGLKKSLKLTDEQTERVAQTFMTFFTKMQETKEANLTQAERKQRNQAAVKERETNLREILTSEQWEKLLVKRKNEQKKK